MTRSAVFWPSAKVTLEGTVKMLPSGRTAVTGTVSAPTLSTRVTGIVKEFSALESSYTVGSSVLK